MSNFIAFLEQVGRDASMRHANHAASLRAMREEDGRSPTMHCQNQVVIKPKMHCQNQVVIKPSRKKSRARTHMAQVTLN